MLRLRLRLVLLSALGVFVAGGVGGWAEAPLILSVAGRASANVSLAASGNTVAAVWSASAASGPTDIFAAISRDGGVSFSTPVRVNATPGQANVNGEQPPRVVLTSGATAGATPLITIVWTAKGKSGTTILTARSTDGGRTFGPSAIVPDGEAAGNRGWEGLAADASGRVGVVWLDHRALAKQGDAMASMHHETSHDAQAAAPAKPDGVAMAQQSKLYYAVVGDPASVRSVTGGVCYCCKTAITYGQANTVALAWRHVYPGNLRDIAFTVSRDGGKSFGAPVRVSEDKWQLEGCPDDGPAMVMDGQGVAQIVWPTLVAGGARGAAPTIGLFYAASRDGKTFSPRVPVPTEGLAHHPQLALAKSGALALVWDELTGGTRRIVFARKQATASGAVSFARQIVAGGEPVVYPVIVASGETFVTAWTSGAPSSSVIRVERR